MEKEFVNYEIALILKEIGFDEPCFGVYPLNGGDFILCGSTERIRPKIESILAPTYSQCFRYFREKYKLQCYPILDTEDVYLCLFSDGIGSGYLLKDGDYGYESDEFLEFNTYEEAEIECLNELIEIVKNK